MTGYIELTPRELDILRLLSDGLSDKQIAYELVLSISTVKWYNRQIYAKLEVANRTQAGAWARELDLANGKSPMLASTPRHNLPRQSTAFVGREQELRDLAGLLATPDVRLITLLGPGGMGKTRLAVEVAARQIETFRDGVYFLSLAPLSSPANMVTALAEAVDFPLHYESEPKAQLLSHIRNKTILLLLDSFEHLRDGVALVSDILVAAPRVKLLSTSRERLNLISETVFALRGLNVPDSETAEDARDYSAVALFLQAARRVRPTFDPDRLQEIVRICRFVAGMPLAILLAAAWTQVLSPLEIAAELARSGDFLETHLRDVPHRHRSIRAVFESTWAQLTAAECDAFMRLSVFREGFTRAAAQAVSNADLLMLMRLADKALVQYDPETGRYSVQNLLREYAAEKLEVSGEALATYDAHMRFYMEMLSQREADLKGCGQRAGLEDIEADFENARAAWERAVTRRQFELADSALESALWFCLMNSRYQDAKALFDQAQQALAPAAGENSHPVWARALSRLIWLQVGYFSPSLEIDLDEKKRQAQRNLAIARQANNPSEIAFCLELLGRIAFNAGSSSEGMTHWDQSLDLLRASGDHFHLARFLVMFGCVPYPKISDERRVNYIQQSLTIRREIGDSFGLAESLGFVGHWTSDNDERECLYQEGLAIARELDSAWNVVNILLGTGTQRVFAGRVRSGKALIEQALALTIERNLPPSQGYALLHLSQVVGYYEADYGQAKQFAEESRPLLAFDAKGLALADARLAYALCGLGDFVAARPHYQAALNFLSGNSFVLRGEQGLFLVASASLAAHEGEPERAAELLGLADARGGTALFRCLINKRLRAELEVELGAGMFASAYERGVSLSFDLVVAEALETMES